MNIINEFFVSFILIKLYFKFKVCRKIKFPLLWKFYFSKWKFYFSADINGKKLCHKDFLNYAIKLFHMEEKKAIKEVGMMRKNYLSAGCLLFYALFDKHKLLVIDEGLREGVCLASMKNIKF